MPYCMNSGTASTIGQWIVDRYVHNVPDAVDGIRFIANSSSTLMEYMVAAEPGKRISVTETVTGVSSTFFINSVEITIKERGFIECYLGLTPDVIPYINDYWVLGGDQLDVGTRLGL